MGEILYIGVIYLYNSMFSWERESHDTLEKNYPTFATMDHIFLDGRNPERFSRSKMKPHQSQ